MEEKKCILYDNKICDNCGECNMCDLDPKKVCDSCGACLDMDDDYNTLDIDLVMEESDDPEMLSYEEMFPEKAFIGENNWDDSDDEEYDDFDNYDDYDEFYDDEEFDDDEDDEDDRGLRRDFGELF